MAKSATDLRNVRIQHHSKARRKNLPDEPECIALSSDEEEPPDKDGSNPASSTAADVNGCKGDDDDGRSSSRSDAVPVKAAPAAATSAVEAAAESPEEDERMLKMSRDLQATVASGTLNKNYASVQCRSIRIGSYKSMPREEVYFTEKALQIKVPGIAKGKQVDAFRYIVPNRSTI